MLLVLNKVLLMMLNGMKKKLIELLFAAKLQIIILFDLPGV